jgi:hypothetical protein
LAINGVDQISASGESYSAGATWRFASSVAEVARGLTANAGDVITVDDYNGMVTKAVAWGFLADA